MEELEQEDLNLIDELISTDKAKDFIIFQRDIYENVLDWKISMLAFNVLFVLFLRTNFIKGYSVETYSGLAEDFGIKEPYLRKILSNLKSNRLVYYKNQQWKRGSFKVYPIGFYRADKRFNNFEEIEKTHIEDNLVSKK